MFYLDSPYLLNQVSESAYQMGAAHYARIPRRVSPLNILRLVTIAEDPNLATMIYANSQNIQESYREGGNFYRMGFGLGMVSLRAYNRPEDIPPIEEHDWSQLMAREAELHDRPAVTTLETAAGLGLQEVRSVNPGYVNGYERVVDVPAITASLGFTGLGALHAHDLLHFASQRA